MTARRKAGIVVASLLSGAGMLVFFAGAREVGFALLLLGAVIFVALGYTTF